MKHDLETRARLLKAAEQLFAARGFKDVPVREICRVARANVAAVNYHFSNKRGLYREVLQVAIDAMRETHESGRRAGESCPPEERLRRYLVVYLERALSPQFETVHRLIQREIDHPTPAMDALVDQAARPRLEYMASIVSEMMDRDADEPTVMRCVGSVFGQLIVYVRKNPIVDRLGFAFKPTAANIAAVARHIADFSVAGIRAVALHQTASSAAR